MRKKTERESFLDHDFSSVHVNVVDTSVVPLALDPLEATSTLFKQSLKQTTFRQANRQPDTSFSVGSTVGRRQAFLVATLGATKALE